MDEDWLESLLGAANGIENESDLDVLLRLLSDRYVRYVLSYLSTTPSTSLDELADVIAGFEAADRGTIIGPEDHDRIRIRLYHVVLPKLDEHGYIQFDTTDQTIELTHVPSPISTLLDEIQ